MSKIPNDHTAIVITQAGGPEVLQPARLKVPEPGPDQVLIRIQAAGINRHDCLQRAAGTHHDGSPIPGLEAAGIVVALGEKVATLKVGDPVMALLQGGGYAEYAVADTALTLPIPDNLSMAEAAASPEALFTAWWNFFDLMQLQSDEFALMHGGTSGVGHLAIQAMSALGYLVLATCGSDQKVAAAQRFGAFAAFNYNDPDLASKVKAATNDKGISALLDVSAGAHFAADLDMMAPDGRIAHLSGGGGATLGVPLKKLMAKRLSITGSLLRPLALPRKAKVADVIRRDVWPLLGQKVRPVIAHTFSLDQAALAHAEMEQGRHIGKIVLSVPA